METTIRKKYKTYFRVYDYLGHEVFASKKLSPCKKFVQAYKTSFIFDLSIRRIVYYIDTDNDAIVIDNSLVISEDKPVV